MKKVLIVSGLSLLVSLSAMGHTLQSQDGINVSHYHFSTCQSGCPDTVGYEQYEGFNSSDRVNNATWEYNCHGRTFDNRNSWVNYSDAWVFGYGNQSPLLPNIGDVVVWTKSGTASATSEITTHTATIVGSWNGTNTIVSSKYGKYGEYRHALSNTIKAYGTNYMVIRLNTANVYSINKNAAEKNSVISDNFDYITESVNEFKKLQKKEKFLTAEERFTLLKNSKLLNKKSFKKRINFLITDLIKEERKYHMYAYSLPEMTADKVARIESGRLLVKIAEHNPELSQEIGDNLKEIIMSRSHDTVRGIAMYYLSEIEKVSGLSWNIGDLFPEVLEKPDKMLYFDYYLNKVQN